MVSGVFPYSFDSTMRTRLPPMLRRAVWRMVCFQRLAGIPRGTGKSGPQAGCGLDVHEPIQLPASAALESGENPTTAASARAKHPVRQLTFAMADAQLETRRSFMPSSPHIFEPLANTHLQRVAGAEFLPRGRGEKQHMWWGGGGVRGGGVGRPKQNPFLMIAL